MSHASTTRPCFWFLPVSPKNLRCKSKQSVTHVVGATSSTTDSDKYFWQATEWNPQFFQFCTATITTTLCSINKNCTHYQNSGSMGWDGVVGTATSLLLPEQRRCRGSIPGRSKQHFSSTQRPQKLFQHPTQCIIQGRLFLWGYFVSTFTPIQCRS